MTLEGVNEEILLLFNAPPQTLKVNNKIIFTNQTNIKSGKQVQSNK